MYLSNYSKTHTKIDKLRLKMKPSLETRFFFSDGVSNLIIRCVEVTKQLLHTHISLKKNSF